MPLILAIVADPQEAAQLATLIQGRLSVDLIQAAEVGEGLLALDDRIPDLILTSPLMSPFDDGVLDEYLRDLGPRGAHVQTLRIPVLSEAPKKKQRLGFSLRRRPKPVETTPEGCEPKVFADEIAQYLTRAAEEKRHASSNDSSGGPLVEEVTAPSSDEVQWTPAYSPDPPTEDLAWSNPEPEQDPVVWRADLLDRRAAEPVETSYESNSSALEVAAPFEETESSSADEIGAPGWAAVAAEPHQAITEEPFVGVIEEPSVAVAEEPLAVVPEQPLEMADEEPSEMVAEEPCEVVVAEEPFAMVAEEHLETVREEHPGTVGEHSGEIVEEPVEMVTEESLASAAEEIAEPEPHVHMSEIEMPAAVSEPVADAPVLEPPVVNAAPSVPGADPHSVKGTPSFRAALAAIRAAWGKPARNTNALDALVRENTPAPVCTASEPEPVATEATPQETAGIEPPEAVETVPEVSAPLEVDLTGAVEMLDEPPAGQAEPAAAASITGSQEDVAPEVYEISVEADLRELESQLFNPLAPPPRREASPPSTPYVPVAETARLEHSSPERPGDRRKKSGKRGEKAAKHTSQREQPQAPVQPVQDEWGIFDPNQCGFAALVDKLDEVSDEKPAPPQAGKVRVISYS